MFNVQYVNEPAFVIMRTAGIREVVNRYPPGFDIMLKPILKCLMQDITDVSDIKDQLYEDTCEGLLIDHCHCGGRIPGCRDCEDSIQIDAMACGFIEAMVKLFNLNSDLRNVLLNSTEPCSFSDFSVIVIDPDSILVQPEEQHVQSYTSSSSDGAYSSGT